MNVNDCYLLVQYLANKAQAGYIKPSQFNLAINQGSNSYLDFLIGGIKERKTGVELWINRKMRNTLSALIAPASTISVDVSGLATYPTGYVIIDAMYTTSMDRVRFVQQNSLYSYLKSTIDPIATNPVYLIEATGFRLYPNNIGNVKISFIKTPPVIAWGFTLDSNSRPVYNAGTSTDPFWDDIEIMEVIGRALRIIGVNLQSQVLNQYAEELKQTGQ
jgi:hypothetical protein